MSPSSLDPRLICPFNQIAELGNEDFMLDVELLDDYDLAESLTLDDEKSIDIKGLKTSRPEECRVSKIILVLRGNCVMDSVWVMLC